MSDRERLEAAGWKLEGDRWRGPVLVTMLSALAIQDAIDAAVAEAVKGERNGWMRELARFAQQFSVADEDMLGGTWKDTLCSMGPEGFVKAVGPTMLYKASDAVAAIRARGDTDE